MQTVALKPKRAEWTALIIGLAILCGIMFAAPVLCLPLALIVPLLACPLVGRKEEPVGWIAAAAPVLSSLAAGYDAFYAVSLLLIGLLPLLITRFVPIRKRPGAAGMVMYVSAMAFSLVVVLCMAAHVLGGPLMVTVPELIVQRMKRMKDLSGVLRQLAIQGLVSIPDGYTVDGVMRPLLQASYHQQMLMSLRLTLELLLGQELPGLFVNACILVGVFTSLRLERMNGVLLVVETSAPGQKQTRVVAAPSFRLLTLPLRERFKVLGIAAIGLLLLMSGQSLAQMAGKLCFAFAETVFYLLGAAVVVFMYTRHDPERKTMGGVMAAALYVLAPFVLLLIGVMDTRLHFRNPQAHKPDEHKEE